LYLLIEEKVGIAASIGIPVKASLWIFTTANVANPPIDERPAAALPMTISPIKQAVLAMPNAAKIPTGPIEHLIQGLFTAQMKTALVYTRAVPEKDQ
jgi:hypothetical protein